MKKCLYRLCLVLPMIIVTVCLNSQDINTAAERITSSDLESYTSFLSSPLLKGRMNGEEGLDIAALFIESQVKLMGLKPADGINYRQSYDVRIKSLDTEKTLTSVISDNGDTTDINKQIFQLVPTGPSDFTVEGEVIFAGYGIRSDKNNYDDFKGIDAEGKILLIMDRAPTSPDGKSSLPGGQELISDMSYQMKLTSLILTKAKAILIVQDPKSGFLSFEQSNPGLAGYLSSTITLDKGNTEFINPLISAMPKIMFVHRSLADALLEESGHTLEELQNIIDNNIKPNSFLIKNKKLRITEVSCTKNKSLCNIVAYIEGSDPVLKDELVIFSGHYDHIGTSGDKVNTGADDNASGCAALLSIAGAFQSLGQKPLRSVLFLWVSGEEIGLYGSRSYIDNPLFPLANTIADINIDMIGRTKSHADSTEKTPMSGPESVFVITGTQSSELIDIAEEIDERSPIDFDYSLSGTDHPLQLFSRSDHFSFVEKDIPVLFFTTGLHTDYHSPRDIVEKIDFNKMEMISRAIFRIGITVANLDKRLNVDNPYSSW